MANAAFRVGDRVKWTSQARGSVRTKVGVIAEIVRPGRRPERERFVNLYKHSGVGLPRDHESYVVLVGKKAFWPRVSHLSLVF